MIRLLVSPRTCGPLHPHLLLGSWPRVWLCGRVAVAVWLWLCCLMHWWLPRSHSLSKPAALARFKRIATKLPNLKRSLAAVDSAIAKKRAELRDVEVEIDTVSNNIVAGP